MIFRKTAVPLGLTLLASWSGAGVKAEGENPQLSIPAVERMPRLPQPLAIRPWSQLSKAYYNRVFDPKAQGDSFPVVSIDPGKPGFRIKSYVGGQLDGEAFSALLGVVGAKLAGLDVEHLHGVNYLERAKAWYDPQLEIYRHRVGDHSPIVHADIYGYWPAIQGLMLAAQHPADTELQKEAKTTFTAFQRIAEGLGCPDSPNFDGLGWDFEKNQSAGRPEPMNRLGNAPSVAWPLLVGAAQTGNAKMLADARAAMQWYVAHPGRYEISHVMGPLTAARLNVQNGDPIDMDKVLAAWFGDGPLSSHPWGITAGTQLKGITCDGLDGARWDNNGFYAFTMGTLQGPAWLVPVVRYDQRYAKAIAKYALNAANSARLLQGDGLDASHQDHAAWKAKWDPDNQLFYEGLASQGPGNTSFLKPYARGDVVSNGWNRNHPKVPEDQYSQQRAEWFGATPENLSLYMGNSIGFLGGILESTDVPGILSWDCVATDWLHPAAYPTRLIFNPYDVSKTVRLKLDHPVDIYNTVTEQFVKKGARNGFKFRMDADEAAVIVEVPRGAKLERRGGQLLANGVVIDYRA